MTPAAGSGPSPIARVGTAIPPPRSLPEAPPATPPEDDDPPPREPDRGTAARAWWGVSLPAAWGALLLACLSLTPSLLPRSGPVQGLVCGITAAMGHGLGLLLAAVWRAFADRGPRPARPGAWRAFAVVALAALVAAFVLGRRWQGQLRDLMGVPGEPVWRSLLAPLVALVVYALLVAIGRAVYAAASALGRLLSRWMGRAAARALGAVAVGLLLFTLVTDVAVSAFVTAADRAFSLADGATPDGVEQPESGLRSGGPGSLVPWEELGREGRTFVADGPSAEEISEITGEPASSPIRVYAGTSFSDDVEVRARAAVDELQRTGGFERSRLLLATTTGSGWLNSSWTAAFEYLSGGDSAIASMQYSYLPSPLSYLFDQTRARTAGRELFDAVYERWSLLPPDDRPELYVFGESLGSFGAEAAFSGEFDLRNRVAGGVFLGPPYFNTLHTEFREDRDPGSPEVEPVYRDGRTVRYSPDAAGGVPPEGTPWTGTRVLYLLHPSDPVSWWSPSLLLEQPDWLREPPGDDVLEDMTWMPLVSFWQVTLDMPFAADVPSGHGHNFAGEAVDAWQLVLRPQGWTEDEVRRLDEVLQR